MRQYVGPLAPDHLDLLAATFLLHTKPLKDILLSYIFACPHNTPANPKSSLRLSTRFSLLVGLIIAA